MSASHTPAPLDAILADILARHADEGALVVSHANAPSPQACARAVERVTREREGKEAEG